MRIQLAAPAAEVRYTPSPSAGFVDEAAHTFFAIPQQREQEEAQAPVANSRRNGSYSFALVLQRNPAPVDAPPLRHKQPRPSALACRCFFQRFSFARHVEWKYVYGKGLSSSLYRRRSS